MIKGMIFDLDGTLLDSMDVWEKIDIEFLGKRGYAVPPDYLEAITPMGFLNAAKYTKERFGFPESAEEIEEEWLAMAEDAYAHTVFVKKDGTAFLQACHDAGMRLAVATSSLERLYIPCLANNGIANLFETAVTTRQAGEDKRSPKIYELAASRLGLAPSECVVFEDILLGLQTARAAGFYTVGVYDACSAKDLEALKNTGHYFAMSYEELLTLGVTGLIEKLS